MSCTLICHFESKENDEVKSIEEQKRMRHFSENTFKQAYFQGQFNMPSSLVMNSNWSSFKAFIKISTN